MSAPTKKCPQCARTGKDIGTCGSMVTCPKQAVNINPAQDLVVACNREGCNDMVRTMSLPAILHGGGLSGLDFTCPMSAENCQCFIVTPKLAQKAAVGGKQA